MLKKIVGPLLVIFVLVFSAASCLAVVIGLEGSKQSVIKVGESVTIPLGADVRSVVAVGGSITVLGQVREDVVAVGGSVFLKESASVGGDTVSIGGKVIKEVGAATGGDITEISAGGFSPAIAYFAKGGLLKGLAVFSLLTFISFVIMAVILVALFTPQLGAVSGALERDFLRNFLIGLLITIIFVPVIVVLAVSLVGVVLIPVWVIVISAACIFGYIAAGHLLGKKALQAFRRTNQSMMAETVTGIVLLSIVGLVPVGGFIIKMIAVFCGLGGVYQTRFGTRS
ncbi:hypothetical protein A2625_05110 [candidate division WOR-1 bacterium RIFCSPHIGHO2_01_FULL_53_15]|uniref:DUF8173 domain-containing protein n=1 Tax=candidate division WOR-1 bacterium RIFCSPHIGHO2_01_FULL_53_15 TaxID=1802564 RepID=A0A1F4Q1L4_UNCSA|nr:MAG: hypothetical protein A2625_05110 [candidate division WOR-1 bacterium RIFCSPHIGHO2_01_FULL_53_15]OGC13051.1 MAG: hypothetical protein A3D23_00055 [candidate division WOR-1 bacterium RIFCSPHIGHO2_02_FULL_53_26]